MNKALKFNKHTQLCSAFWNQPRLIKYCHLARHYTTKELKLSDVTHFKMLVFFNILKQFLPCTQRKKSAVNVVLEQDTKPLMSRNSYFQEIKSCKGFKNQEKSSK